MSSNINPNNIDGTYPVAGQDNNSQGFRDNFTNIKTNFQYAEDEISELQSKALLKAPLTGTSVVNNDMLGQPLSNGVLGDMGYQYLDLLTPSGSTVTINYAEGQYQAFQTSQAFNLAFSNFPPAGVAGELYVRVNVQSTSHTMTLPVQVGTGQSARALYGIQGLVFNGGDPISSPGSYTGSTITFAQTGTYNFRFTSTDGGSTITVYDLNRPLNYYTNPLFLAVPDTFAGTGNVNLNTSTTLFVSNASVTGNLQIGTSGQIKILAYGNATSGNTLINVVNAGWKASGNGTANLSAVGSAATFQYTNSKWYCVGNNGVSFT